ncbi:MULTISPECIES: hypothetical protein [Aeromonas]|uniref:hypothetical protein n=1 Tax=Aeromonas TaxID=642 RepID=UPI0012D4A343|nr:MULTISPECIES: hypothetical protein [Aeromonas]MBF8449264.1 hypothetical protein [Aeromonas dhakensis]MCR3901549.1 hypothetical protein [Aeromonas hydrophila]WGY30655.1 hypothetical protein QK281_13605 [Aeromonas hydrophila]HDC4323469.1 hypothetical protein [Aeromonas hydrophila]
MYQLKVVKTPDVDNETFENALAFSCRRIEDEIEGLHLQTVINGDIVTITSLDPQELKTANQDELMRKIVTCFCYRDQSLYEDFGSVAWLSYWP